MWKTIGLWLIRVLVTPEHIDAMLAWLRKELLAWEARNGSQDSNPLLAASGDATFKARFRAEAESILRG